MRAHISIKNLVHLLVCMAQTPKPALHCSGTPALSMQKASLPSSIKKVVLPDQARMPCAGGASRGASSGIWRERSRT